MKKLYSGLLLLSLSACSLFPNSEVIMRASPEAKPSRSPMPPTEKPLAAPPSEVPVIAPRIGLRVPLGQ